MKSETAELLSEVDRLLASDLEDLPPAWARAAVFLLRQALESRLADVWRARGVAELADASFSAQLTCLREFTSDEALVEDVTYTWHSLSSACHHRGFGMPPSRGSLAKARRDVGRLVDGFPAHA